MGSGSLGIGSFLICTNPPRSFPCSQARTPQVFPISHEWSPAFLTSIDKLVQVPGELTVPSLEWVGLIQPPGPHSTEIYSSGLFMLQLQVVTVSQPQYPQ